MRGQAGQPVEPGIRRSIVKETCDGATPLGLSEDFDTAVVVLVAGSQGAGALEHRWQNHPVHITRNSCEPGGVTGTPSRVLISSYTAMPSPASIVTATPYRIG